MLKNPHHNFANACLCGIRMDRMYLLCVQLELQQALLSVGEFQTAVDQLMSLISQTLAGLDQPPPLYTDPRTIDAELSRLRVLIFRPNITALCLF